RRIRGRRTGVFCLTRDGDERECSSDKGQALHYTNLLIRGSEIWAWPARIRIPYEANARNRQEVTGYNGIVKTSPLVQVPAGRYFRENDHNRSRRVPPRLPGHLCDVDDGRTRPGHLDRGRSQSPVHPGFFVRQGESVRRAYVSRRPAENPASA